MESYRRQSLQNEFLGVDSHGEKGLHWLIRKGSSSSQLIRYIGQIGLQAACDEATTVNNEGLLPLDLLMQSEIALEEKAQICNIIFLLYRLNQFHLPPLNILLTLESVFSQYPAELGSSLYFNLTAACVLVNLTRSWLAESDTHPQFNEFPTYLRQINTKIQQIRWHIRNIKRGAGGGLAPALQLKILEEISQICRFYGAGNCYEYSMLALYFLKLLLPNLPAAVMGIGNGDHIFVVIGDPSLETFNNDDHNLNLLPIDYRYLEKAAVVCDAWLGRVFPVSTLEENLKNYRCVPLITGVYINVITSFNPNYHYIKPVFTLPGTRQYDLPPAVNAYPIEEKENDNSDLVSFSANEANFWNSRRLEAATPPMNFNRMQEEEESFAQAYFSVNDANFWNTRSRASSSQIEEESSAAASFSINSAHRMLMDEG